MEQYHSIGVGAPRKTAIGVSETDEKEEEMTKLSRFPAGWNEQRVRALLKHYESQTEEEVVAEDEAAFRRRDQTVMVVPRWMFRRVRATQKSPEISVRRSYSIGSPSTAQPKALRKIDLRIIAQVAPRAGNVGLRMPDVAHSGRREFRPDIAFEQPVKVAHNFEKADAACKAFGCKPYFAIVIDAADVIRAFLMPMDHLLKVFPASELAAGWRCRPPTLRSITMIPKSESLNWLARRFAGGSRERRGR